MDGFRKNGVIFRVENLNLTLGGKHVLRDINLEVHDTVCDVPGAPQTPEIISFFGPSGIGKSQMSLCLASLQPHPFTGKILAGRGLEPTSPGLVGMVAQNYPLLQHRRVLGNLRLSAMRSGKTKKEATDISYDFLKKFGMEDQAKKFPSELSGGQKQRVAIIQQLVGGKKYLILDEPLSGLDPNAKRIVCDTLLQIGQLDGESIIIIVSHSEESLRISNRVWIMGRERDANGGIIPGAKIMYDIDFVAEGLLQPDGYITRNERFREIADYIRDDLFPTL